MLTPPLMKSASTTLMRRPSRMMRDLISTGARVGQPEHVHRQPRRHEISGAMACLDGEGQQSDHNPAMQRVRVPRVRARRRSGDRRRGLS